jgi:hypothetical protein
LKSGSKVYKGKAEAEGFPMIWFGADPGGDNKFGVPILREDCSFDTDLRSSAEEAMDWLKEKTDWLKQEPSAAGIDAPLWWSAGQRGWRKADCKLKNQYPKAAKVVLALNSLMGACLVQGVMLAIHLRERFRSLPITEAHPKALLWALDLNDDTNNWPKLAERFGLKGDPPVTEHQRDALLAAVAAREGFLKRWPNDLATDRFPEEQDPAKIPHAPIVYWWPDV